MDKHYTGVYQTYVQTHQLETESAVSIEHVLPLLFFRAEGAQMGAVFVHAAPVPPKPIARAGSTIIAARHATWSRTTDHRQNP